MIQCLISFIKYAEIQWNLSILVLYIFILSLFICVKESGMPANIKFRKSVLTHYMHHIFSTYKLNRLVCTSIFLGACVTPGVQAEQNIVESTMGVQPATPPAADQVVQQVMVPATVNTEKLEEAASQLGIPAQKIDEIQNKVVSEQSVPEFDSVAMLQQQSQNLENDAAFKPIQFEDMEELPVAQVDQAMADEIFKVAEDAKTEAQNFRNGVIKSPEITVSDATQQELREISQAPVNVDTLMHDIQADSHIRVSENELGKTLAGNSPEFDQIEPEKVGLFGRLFHKAKPVDTAANEKITVEVKGAPTLLEHNIKAKLSAFTVEAFEDYESAVPQLRSLANHAAQAVGYYNAQFKFEHLGPHKVLVHVTENEPVKIATQEIEYTGAGENLPQLQVIRVLPDQEKGDIFHHGLYENTKIRITDAAANNGFFDSYWRLHDVKVSQPQNTADINLKFETGNRYKLGEVEFRMSDPSKPLPIDLKILKSMAPWQDGADYTAWRVNALSNNLTNSRYFNYTLVDAIKPDPIQKPLELAPDLQALVDQQKITASELAAASDTPKVVAASKKEVSQTVVDEKQFAGTDQVEKRANLGMLAADAEEKQSEQERLQQQAREQQKIPVIVTLNADRLNSLETGIGYGTDTGVRLRSQYRRAIVNHLGHSFDANLELSQVRQAFDGRYSIPYNHPLNDYISLVGGYEREEHDSVGNDLSLVIESAVAGADRIIKGSRKEWQHIFGVRYRLDRVTQNGNVDIANIPDAFVIPGAQAQQQALLLGYQASKTNSDNRVNPTQGFKQTYKIQLGSESLLSDTNMAIADVNWKFLYSFGENADHQVVGSSALGYIFADDFEKVPYNLRYFAGGDQSLRGFDYKSLSPKEYGYKVGGQALAVGSLEYNYQFKDGWRAALFTDFGNAYDQNFSNETEYSLGLGIRWKSPIGPIRLDVASGISDDSHPIRLHFFIGSQL